MNKVIHLHSRISWAKLQGVELTSRQKKILDFMAWANKALTDREIKRGMGFEDMNQVRPRITELVKANALIQNGVVMDKATKRPVRRVMINPQLTEDEQRDLFL